MKPAVSVAECLRSWTVKFTIGNQSFRLAHVETKMEAQWYAKMLRKAFKNLKEGGVK